MLSHSFEKDKVTYLSVNKNVDENNFKGKKVF